uniref:SUMO-activating enzyme subunit n=1 Tax=Attheya septentrionalis TaxID=420275 RepID=A0A7S2U773_9STRA|mmetsp:Transcript_1134/g.2062  ORF Transcript_1134/g.2062 Transcript_1134/m.2062 type:complete len:682 (+) Transcript_1134:60-2105(+)|eukprot:CAMPEP_0198298682 /NCGR_PEP_ID=MMETSP1449-20131203/41750_1 /TAXON_ID=420275 /ORGANISM="Attheya septentrionalis, Strain CCMP2084" /LENGTH=681 /DNA_ID=CAMNT_0044000013 /DNA_START=39 /DNA_END=2087 /DNA_ORIENTATION=-
MSSVTNRHGWLSGIEATLGSDLMQHIQTSRILLVGAGGIGCELLKNLALSGFRDVEVIDLDTIDVSNLNRQFLFRSRHVGMPKCTVACEAALSMICDDKKDDDDDDDKALRAAKYVPHHGNVCDNSKFNVPYVKQFNLVLNALDNVEARRRVNRLCLAASVPLIEAGTTGYFGQVTVIDKSSGVECYECQPKPTQKVYPICTIRSTPSMPVHTIVWAKELYKLLFGPKVEESMLFEDNTVQSEEPSTYMDAVLKLRDMIFQTSSIVDNDVILTTVQEVITTMFATEIQKQLDTGRYKTAKKTPAPLDTSCIVAGIKSALEPPTKRPSYKATDMWSIEDNVAEFASSLVDGAAASNEAILPEFDKDDALAMRLVTAAANLRSHVFGIDPLQSYYSAKGIAGNIIPAIATTNAIVAGLQVMQVFSILRAQSENKADQLKDVCKFSYCRRETTRKGYYLVPTVLPDPNPSCFVCRNATIPLALNVHKWTLQSLLSRIIKKDLGFQEPTLLLNGDIIWEEGDDADSESYTINLSKFLSNLPCGGISDGTILHVEDFTQNLEVEVCITHKEVWETSDEEESRLVGEEEDEKFILGGEKPTISKQEPTAPPKPDETANEKSPVVNDEDDDVVEVTDAPTEKTNTVEKRLASETTNGDGGNSNSPPTKKQRVELDASVEEGNEVIELD